ncbi:MAG: DMT family transporter [Methanomethylophilus sp.]|jgi:quaternary ammonium compound-resistance protein SugE
MDPLVFVIVGGLFEPAWVFTMEKGGTYKDDPRRKWFWYLVCAFFLYCSLGFMSKGMQGGMDVGVTYAIWTAVGALVTLAISVCFMKEKLNWLKVIAVMMILAGIAGLELAGD